MLAGWLSRMSKALPKGGSACARVQVSNTRLGSASVFDTGGVMTIRTSLAILGASLALAVPAGAQEQNGIADFLNIIGGDTELRTVDGHMKPSPYTGTHRLTVPLRRDANHLLGYRFFKEKLRDDGMVTANRGREAFADECVAKGGTIEPETSPVTEAFHKRVLTDIAHQDYGTKHRWTGLVAVCTRGGDTVLGGYLAAVYDPTAAPSIFGRTPTKTAIYAYRSRAILSARALQSDATYREERFVEQQRQNEALLVTFREGLDVGSATSCGTVIQVRGPMVEIALPPTSLTPNGQSTFWAKRERLYPVGRDPCLFGL